MGHWDRILVMIFLLIVPGIGTISSGEGYLPSDVLDTERPEISNVSLEGPLTTGDPVTISVDVDDDVNVSTVWLVHNWTQPSNAVNLSFMRAGNMFSITILVPANATRLWYMVKANDTSDNWNSTAWNSSDVTDNDPPTFLFDGSTDTAYTGDAFGFVTNMDDNIGIFRASVNFTIDNVNYHNFSMCGVGNSRQTLIVLPLTANGTLSYRFWFNDNAGNEGTSPLLQRMLFDDDPPFVLEDLTDDTAVTGELLGIHIRAEDNWGIEEAFVEYSMEGWYRSPSRVDLVIPQDGNFTLGISMPVNWTGDLVYNATFVDGSNNSYRTDDRTVHVVDGISPKMVKDLSDMITTTGEEMVFAFNIRDNIEVSEVAVTYLIPGEDWYTSYAVYDENWELYRYILDVPADMEGEGEYYVNITDTSGNFFISAIGVFYIFDNDEPEIIFEESDETAMTGENFTFRIALWDNIGVSSVIVEYQINGMDHLIELQRTIPISKGHLYEATIEIPENGNGNMSYSYLISDHRGNLNDLYGEVGMIDSIPPMIKQVRFIDEPTGEVISSLTTGDVFRVEVDVVDNLDPFSVEFVYKLPGSVIEINLDLTRGLKFNNTRTFNVIWETPTNVTGPVNYNVIAIDGIHEVTFSETVFLLDNDPPELVSIEYPEEIGFNSFLNITLETVDNIQVKSAWIGFNSSGSYNSEDILEEMETDDGRIFKISMQILLGGLEPLNISVWLSDGMSRLHYPISIAVIDDVGPEVTFTGTSSNDHPDDSPIFFQMTVVDLSGWEVVSIAMVRGESGIVIIDYTQYSDLIEFNFFPTEPGSWQLQVHLRDFNDVHSIHTYRFLVYDNKPPYFQIGVPGNITIDDVVKLEILDYQDSSAISTIEWTVTDPDGESKVLHGNSIEFIPMKDGDYRISVTITDQSGNSRQKETWLRVDPGNEPPDVNWPVAILIILTVLVGGLVLWLTIKDKLPEWLKSWKER